MESITRPLTNKDGTIIIYPHTLEECVKDRDGRSLADKLNNLTSVTVDSAMSDTSTNPVQNKIIKQYIDENISASLGDVINTIDAVNRTVI